MQGEEPMHNDDDFCKKGECPLCDCRRVLRRAILELTANLDEDIALEIVMGEFSLVTGASLSISERGPKEVEVEQLTDFLKNGGVVH